MTQANDEKAPTGRMPRRLPVVIILGRAFYRDDRLRELRAVDNPHDRIPFDWTEEEERRAG
jgi:hypothetical protein